MSNRRTYQSLSGILTLALIILPACTKKQDTSLDTQANKTAPVSENTSEPDETGPIVAESKSAISAETGLEEKGPLYRVHFDYDRYEIGPDSISIMNRNASYLKANPTTFIRIEGHCDDRGSVEYNQALGERRANSAKQWLSSAGIKSSLMDTVSFGEDRPLLHEANEYAWQMNRRAEFKILSD